MAYQNIRSGETFINTDNESIVIPYIQETKRGGACIDFTGFTPSVLHAGHIIIYNSTSGVYAPMPISGTNYGTLPDNFAYFGVLINTIEKSNPFGSILTRGQVNPNAMPYGWGSISSAVISALPHITWVTD